MFCPPQTSFLRSTVNNSKPEMITLVCSPPTPQRMSAQCPAQCRYLAEGSLNCYKCGGHTWLFHEAGEVSSKLRLDVRQGGGWVSRKVIVLSQAPRWAWTLSGNKE